MRDEGEVLFLDDGDNYLGLIHNYTQRESRTDFGSIYIKGNGSYALVHPWRDGNASRLLYSEYTASLTGKDAVHLKTMTSAIVNLSESYSFLLQSAFHTI